jgi:hypothetical protein
MAVPRPTCDKIQQGLFGKGSYPGPNQSLVVRSIIRKCPLAPLADPAAQYIYQGDGRLLWVICERQDISEQTGGPEP